MASDDEANARNPVLITEAAPSLEEQRRGRVRRYTIIMAFRIPCLVIGAWVYSTFHSWPIALAIVGVSIPLPWIAVLIANDRPPRKKSEYRRYAHADEVRALEARKHGPLDQG